MNTLLPLFPLDLVLFPDAAQPLHIFEPRYKEMIGECLQRKAPFGMVRTYPKEGRLADVGCTADITELLQTFAGGRMNILTMGRRRFEVLQTNEDRSFLRAEVLFFDDEAGAAATPESRVQALELHHQLNTLAKIDEVTMDADADLLSFHLAAALPADLDLKQALLEMRSEKERIGTLLDYYQRLIPQLRTVTAARQRAGGNGYVH